jgi:hypothetical protein
VFDHESRDRLAGIGLAVLGVIVLALAIVALRNPGRSTSGGAAADVGQTQVTSPPTSSHAQSAPARHRTSPSVSPTPSGSTPSGSSSGSASGSVSPSDSPSASPSDAPSDSPTSASPADKQIPLIVENNTSTTGLAAGAETRFEAAGWTVTHIGTLQNDIVSTCAYYDPTQAGAKHAAEALKAEFPEIKRVAPRFAELPPGPIVVVLTWDYQSG